MERATTRRHLLAALCTLGAETGTIEERLRAAYERGLSRVSRNPGLPGHLQADYDELMAGFGRLFEAGRTAGRSEASELAKQVVALYDRFIRDPQRLVTRERGGPSGASSRAREQLYEIVFMLASEAGSIEERLAGAYAQFRAIDTSVLPPPTRERFDKIYAALTALYPAPGKVDGVDQNEAINLAMGIILLYDDLNRDAD